MRPRNRFCPRHRHARSYRSCLRRSAGPRSRHRTTCARWGRRTRPAGTNARRYKPCCSCRSERRLSAGRHSSCHKRSCQPGTHTRHSHRLRHSHRRGRRSRNDWCCSMDRRSQQRTPDGRRSSLALSPCKHLGRTADLRHTLSHMRHNSRGSPTRRRNPSRSSFARRRSSWLHRMQGAARLDRRDHRCCRRPTKPRAGRKGPNRDGRLE